MGPIVRQDATKFLLLQSDNERDDVGSAERRERENCKRRERRSGTQEKNAARERE